MAAANSLHMLVQYIKEKLQSHNYASIAYIHSHLFERLTIKKLAEIEHYHPELAVPAFASSVSKYLIEDQKGSSAASIPDPARYSSIFIA